MKILIIESDDIITGKLALTLRSAGLTTIEIVPSAEDGVELATLYEYDLAIIGDNLCDMDADALVKRLRRSGVKVPVVIFSYEGDPERKVRLLNAGADEYIQYPAHADEIVARCQAVARRTRGLAENLLEVGPITINLTTRDVRVDGEPLRMTDKEQRVLTCLAMRSGRLVSKDTIMEELYGHEADAAPEIKIVDVFVCKIRNKLRRFAAAGHLETVWGQGYRLMDANAGDPAAKAEVVAAQRLRVLAYLLDHPNGRSVTQIEQGLKESLAAYWAGPLLAAGHLRTDVAMGGRYVLRVYAITPAGAAHLARHQQQAA